MSDDPKGFDSLMRECYNSSEAVDDFDVYSDDVDSLEEFIRLVKQQISDAQALADYFKKYPDFLKDSTEHVAEMEIELKNLKDTANAGDGV